MHDLHVWPLSTTVNALTAHVEHDGTRDGDALLRDAEAAIQQRFGISHTTIQLENSAAMDAKCLTNPQISTSPPLNRR